MRRLLAIVVVAVVACSGSGGDDGRDVSAISYRLLRTEGEASLGDYAGTPLVVNFFGTTCEPCLREMPALERVHQAYGDRVAFLGLNVQDTVEDALALVDQTGITWDLGRDPRGEIIRELDSIGMPTTVLIDPDSRLLELHLGELSEQELTDLLEDHFFS